MSGEWPGRRVRVGPFGFHLRSPVASVIDQVDALYCDYPLVPEDEVVDFMVAVRPASPFRRVVRPKIVLECDFEIPMMAPQPLSHGLLALEMGMNLQVAAGMSRFVLLHAGSVARGGGGIVMSGDSGAGKSTLAAMLGHGGWRFLGDEFALLDVKSGELVPFPRPISLKNESIALLEAVAPAERFGPRMDGTIKGAVRHLAPPLAAIAAMDERVTPKLFLIPAFTPGVEATARPLPRVEIFAALTRSSTNYWKLGEPGFDAVWRFAGTVPGYEIVYASHADAEDLIDTLWAAHG